MSAFVTATDVELQLFLQQLAAAKRCAARLYDACIEFAKPAGIPVDPAALATDARYAASLLAPDAPTTEASRWSTASPPAVASWESALLLALSLDEAANAGLVGLAKAADPRLVLLSEDLLASSNFLRHLAVAELGRVVAQNPDSGPRLAREMIGARDWIKAIFPRHEPLVRLTNAGLLQPQAPAAHDGYLASLGDRIQEALGVLGDL